MYEAVNFGARNQAGEISLDEVGPAAVDAHGADDAGAPGYKDTASPYAPSSGEKGAQGAQGEEGLTVFGAPGAADTDSHDDAAAALSAGAGVPGAIACKDETPAVPGA